VEKGAQVLDVKTSDAYGSHWALNDPSKNCSCPHL